MGVRRLYVGVRRLYVGVRRLYIHGESHFNHVSGSYLALIVMSLFCVGMRRLQMAVGKPFGCYFTVSPTCYALQF